MIRPMFIGAAPPCLCLSAQVTAQVQDGVRVAASTIVQHYTDNWRYGRAEVLKGPAAVLYGEGAVAGVTTAAPRSFEIARASRL